MYIPIAKPERELSKISNLNKNFSTELRSGRYVGGKNVELLESSIKNFLKVKYVSTVNSGTDALILSLIALGIGEGDEVIVPSFTYFATVEAILQVRAVPVFADVENNSFCISLDTVKNKITNKTKCIIPVHLYGYNSDIENISKFAKKNNIKVIEDTAQAFASKSDENNFLGSYGEINAFSNFPSKTLGGIGDGGFITTNNKDLFTKINMLKNHGQISTYNHKIVGYNSRLDSLNAFILKEKLNMINEIIDSRSNFKNFYLDIFQNIEYVNIPKFNENTVLNYFSILLPSEIRDKFKKELSKRNIESNIYYEIPIHLQDALKIPGIKSRAKDLTNTESISKQVLSLPLFSFPLKKELTYLKKSLKEILFLLN